MIRHTSRAAGKSVKGKASQQMRATIFDAILRAGSSGLTIEEIVTKTGIKLQTVCARRKELEDKRLIMNSGSKRPTSSGRSAIVWVVPASVTKALLNRKRQLSAMKSA